jgi:hypothetical protein
MNKAEGWMNASLRTGSAPPRHSRAHNERTVLLEEKIMTRFAATTLKVLPLIARTALVSALLAAPVLAVPATGDRSLRIEAPALKKSGAGLVLLVSLQRG